MRGKEPLKNKSDSLPLPAVNWPQASLIAARPTESTVDINVLPRRDIQGKICYRKRGEGTIMESAPREMKSGVPYVIPLTNLVANQGYRVFLNGTQIHQYGWWTKEPLYTPYELGANEAKHLKKGTNVLAVYVVAAPKGPQSDEPVAQFDLRIEGLRKSDLLGDAEKK
jgi:hypothetical protein